MQIVFIYVFVWLSWCQYVRTRNCATRSKAQNTSKLLPSSTQIYLYFFICRLEGSISTFQQLKTCTTYILPGIYELGRQKMNAPFPPPVFQLPFSSEPSNERVLRVLLLFVCFLHVSTERFLTFFAPAQLVCWFLILCTSRDTCCDHLLRDYEYIFFVLYSCLHKHRRFHTFSQEHVSM